MATSPPFPSGLHVSKKMRLDQYFYGEKKPPFVMQMRADRKLAGTSGSKAMRCGSQHTEEEMQITHNTFLQGQNTLLCSGSLLTACLFAL